MLCVGVVELGKFEKFESALASFLSLRKGVPCESASYHIYKILLPILPSVNLVILSFFGQSSQIESRILYI